MQPSKRRSPVFRQQIFLVNNYFGSLLCNSDGVHMAWDMHSVAAPAGHACSAIKGILCI